MAEESKKQYVNVLFEEKLLSRVDDFRFKNRFASRTVAIRWLIKAALNQMLATEGGVMGKMSRVV
jgi:metal-responsive CopG/Arc/MetJ family transcriptional regulator